MAYHTMKNSTLACGFVLLFFCFCNWAPAQEHETAAVFESTSIVTFNIRYASPSDGENRWQFRRQTISEFLGGFDIICLQEVLPLQLEHLVQALRKHEHYAVGRDDGGHEGEHCAIFFRSDAFRLVNADTFWLSPPPASPGSLGWDAVCTRIVSWTRLQHLKSNQELLVFNTHFDHQGDEARKQSALLLVRKIRQLTGGAAVLLAGDFNDIPNSVCYQRLHQQSIGDQIELRDAGALAKQRVGPVGTWNGFRQLQPRRIDYIFASDNLQILRYETHLLRAAEDRFASDHLPVAVEFSPAQPTRPPQK